jgi:RNA polymerase sigma-70 factor (ECF subfamily)
MQRTDCEFDQAYLDRLANGDPETQRHFTRYFSELLSVKLRTRVRSRQLAEDVRQETFLRVLDTIRRKGGIDRPERLGAFVHSVCNNVLFESFRAEGRTAPLPEEGFDPVDPSDDLEAEFVKDDRRQRVRKLLAELAEKDREVLRLVFMEERDKDEICRIMNVDRGYLRVLVHRATNRLRESYKRATSAVLAFFALSL